MALIRSIATIGGLTVVSRIAGFVRDMLIAAILGAGPGADAFFVAFKFPNLFRRLFAEGAFNAAFVPLFASELEERGPHGARVFAESVQAMLFWVLLAVVVVMELSMPWVMHLLAPGFSALPGQHELAVALARLTFPYLLFVSLVSLLGGVLNGLGRFAAAAATPILLNLVLIAAVLGLSPLAASPGHALSWGTALAGVVQFLWLSAASAKAGFALRPCRPRLTPQMRLLMRRMVPGAIGAGVYQLNLLVGMVVASALPSGAISYLFYADRVNQLPLGVVGMAISTALLPTLARQLRAGRHQEAADSQNRALEFAFLLTLPCAAALVAISGPIVAVLFERGAFGPTQAEATAQALAAFSIGLPAYVLVKVLGTAFYAREDTVTPVKLAAIGMAANLALTLALAGPLAHQGVALATALSAWVNAVALGVVLWRHGHFALDARLALRLPRILAASLIMGALLAGGAVLLAVPLAGEPGSRAVALAGLVLGGGGIFLALAHSMGATDLREIGLLFAKNR